MKKYIVLCDGSTHNLLFDKIIFCRIFLDLVFSVWQGYLNMWRRAGNVSLDGNTSSLLWDWIMYLFLLHTGFPSPAFQGQINSYMDMQIILHDLQGQLQIYTLGYKKFYFIDKMESPRSEIDVKFNSDKHL